MTKPHKFVSNQPTGQYNVVIFCEYCGLVIFYSNRDMDFAPIVKARQDALLPCPNSPDVETVHRIQKEKDKI